jgi:hypothetical protein
MNPFVIGTIILVEDQLTFSKSADFMADASDAEKGMYDALVRLFQQASDGVAINTPAVEPEVA